MVSFKSKKNKPATAFKPNSIKTVNVERSATAPPAAKAPVQGKQQVLAVKAPAQPVKPVKLAKDGWQKPQIVRKGRNCTHYRFELHGSCRFSFHGFGRRRFCLRSNWWNCEGFQLLRNTGTGSDGFKVLNFYRDQVRKRINGLWRNMQFAVSRL